MDTSLWNSFSNKMNDPCGIKHFFREKGLAIKHFFREKGLAIIHFFREKGLALFHFLVVLVISILAPLYDNIKDWILVIILTLSGNYAWGCLFTVPIVHG